ncbi:MAG TPA: hypothetical protein PKA63_04765 [Oligoflexia bacterium]|nr:hypothetical protein [Oligoflexia bacterium]HMP47962.1 hypothetical protein [Oligoflexia bacterium]
MSLDNSYMVVRAKSKNYLTVMFGTNSLTYARTWLSLAGNPGDVIVISSDHPSNLSNLPQIYNCHLGSDGLIEFNEEGWVRNFSGWDISLCTLIKSEDAREETKIILLDSMIEGNTGITSEILDSCKEELTILLTLSQKSILRNMQYSNCTDEKTFHCICEHKSLKPVISILGNKIFQKKQNNSEYVTELKFLVSPRF